ncbi:hypothetical protein [Paenibacillus sp. UMB4589-SE434]|uniref:hypothetical protein n=1 Tax=Paenibacillus sp. UMB4589-SE434 TaxID=3046314 RepID=UPI00254F4D47|nr:hypothetical protein [Paenibacillus sp. UMB4589-SE434]
MVRRHAALRMIFVTERMDRPWPMQTSFHGDTKLIRKPVKGTETISCSVVLMDKTRDSICRSRTLYSKESASI